MIDLKPELLFTPEFSDELSSSPINGTKTMGVYSPMQFVLRLREDLHRELESIKLGVHFSNSFTSKQIQAFSTYLHETIHWWQHVGSNFGLLSSLKFPAQEHIIYSELKTLLNTQGAFKPISKFDWLHPGNSHVNKILNYWHDIEFAGQIAFDPNRMNTITQNPYFECWGHSYELMWSSAIWTLASTIDRDFSFLPNIKKWEDGFRLLRERKVESFYYGSPNTLPPLGTKAIFEGQARFSQLQYLYASSGGKCDMNDFGRIGMLNGVYIEAITLFLDILGEKMPIKADDSLIGLFLLVCDLAINPTDGFPFDIVQYESFIFLNDPGYRFCILCQMIRDEHSNLKSAILSYSKEEYIEVSSILTKSIGCFSPHESAAYILRWIDQEPEIQKLLEQEKAYKYPEGNLPIRLFFSKFLRFQEDKFCHPQVFCWPGLHLVDSGSDRLDLSEVSLLFDRHKALFIDDVHGNIYHSAIKGHTEQQVDETLNAFFSWNCVYDMARKWIIEEGPFKFNYEWLTSKYTKEEMKQWASNNFEASFGIRPEAFKFL